MKSEELEQSLRSEFEGYLKDVVAKMRSDVDEFQKQIESEFDKQRSHISDAFRSFSNRFDTLPEFDGGFRETVMEHLRLARDEGAQITATAMAEAEDLERAAMPPAVDLSEIRDALDDISGKDTQSAILKSLISHAAKYTPRGAFFIIKNDHFAGWRVFGKEATDGESAIREVHFPLASDSILSSSVRSLKSIEGSFGNFAEDVTFLDPLHFGQPDRMHAIPLVARGRGVAVLYCDYGHEGVTVNTDALEMLVKVAGLTVELLASTKAFQVGGQPEPRPQFIEGSRHSVQSDEHPVASENVPASAEAAWAEPSQSSERGSTLGAFDAQFREEADPESSDFSTAGSLGSVPPALKSDNESFSEDSAAGAGSQEGSFDFRSQFETAPEYVPDVSQDISDTLSFSNTGDGLIEEPVREKIVELEQTQSAPSHNLPQPSSTSWPYIPEETTGITGAGREPALEALTNAPELVFDDARGPFGTSVEPAVTPSLESPSQFVPDGSPSSFHHAPEPTVGEPENINDRTTDFDTAPQTHSAFESASTPTVDVVAAKPPTSRLSNRNVDLPIEVSDDERRLHNDARRFARLLVSEIKLYNEKKVQEGRESNDLYERLREAIERSREMYDKRVQPPVAAKFDYFHYELVNSLAEGSEEKLGQSYKGAAV